MTPTERDAIARGTAEAIRNVVTPLIKRIEELEARPELKYCGIHREGEQYGAGSLVTRNGALWFAEKATVNYPGSMDSGWRLIVKSGAA